MSASRDHDQSTTSGKGTLTLAALSAEIGRHHAKCPDYADFPTAWAIQRWSEAGGNLEHHPRCSSVPGWDPISGPHFLCDCGAVTAEWGRRFGPRGSAAGVPAQVADDIPGRNPK